MAPEIGTYAFYFINHRQQDIVLQFPCAYNITVISTIHLQKASYFLIQVGISMDLEWNMVKNLCVNYHRLVSSV